MNRFRLTGRLMQLLSRRLQNLLGLAFDVADRAQGNVESIGVGEQLLDLAFGQTEGSGQQNNERLESGSEGPAGNAVGKGGAGGGLTMRAS